MSGAPVSFDWHGRPARAWVPDRLSDRDLTLRAPTAAAAESAVDQLRAADTLISHGWEPLARLMLRTEGIASSSIEGLRAPLDDIARAELDPTSGDVGWIVDNLHAMEAALSTAELTVDALHSWHRSLMVHSRLPTEMVGAFRAAPSWIGGTSPLDAAFVPPPPAHVAELMDDLIAFANDTPCDPVTHAAVVHAQFETIHPYGDGNGRMGRALIGWVLRRRRVIQNYPPPISVLLARDAGGYISGLHLYRTADLNPWVRWFAQVTHAAAVQSHDIFGQVQGIIAEWSAVTSHLRADSAARRAVRILPQLPVLNARHLADALDVSRRAALNALTSLAELDIVVAQANAPTGPGRPDQWFAAVRLLDTARRWTG